MKKELKKRIKEIKANKELYFENQNFIKNVMPATYYKKKLTEQEGKQNGK